MNKTLYNIACILVIVGALNWGVVGAANVNAVDKLTHAITANNAKINKTIYILVGVAALVVAYAKLTKKQ